MKWLAIVLVVVVQFGFEIGAEAATSCSKEFEFLGATDETSAMLWIGKRVGGECYYSSLITISLTDSGVVVKGSGGDYNRDFSGVKSALSRLRPLHTTTYKVIHPHCTSVANNCCLGTTTREPELLDSLKRMLSDGTVVGASQWDHVMGERGIELPRTLDCDLKLAAYDPGGLYVDYEIDRMYTFAGVRYVLIFTRQKRLGFGLGQLHGYLLLEIVAQE